MKSDERDLQIDFVTWMHRAGNTPVLIKALNASMQPLKFMEFSMEAPIQITLLAQRGAITVNAPPPEKIRPAQVAGLWRTAPKYAYKASKDLAQDASLTYYLGKNDAELLAETWAGLIGRSPRWRSRAMEGLTALKEHYPGLDTSALVV